MDKEAKQFCDGFETQLAMTMSTEDGRAELKGLFDALDRDADGAASSKLWSRALGANEGVVAKYFGGSTVPQISSAIDRIDTGRDGRLTWLEFESAAHKDRPEKKARTPLMAACEAGNLASAASARGTLWRRGRRGGAGSIVFAKPRCLRAEGEGGKSLACVAAGAG